MKQYFTFSLNLLTGLMLLSGLVTSVAWGQAPTVVSRQPVRNAPAAPRLGPVVVQFSQAITAASATRLRVYGNQGRGLRPGTLSGGGTATLSFAPTQPFAPGERVSVSIPPTLANAAGVGASRQVYEFTAATGGNGRGFFLDTTETVRTGSRDQLLGDIDGDGDLDLLTASGLYGMYSYLNDGQGHFTPYFNTVVGQTPSGATLADINQDGYLDLLAGDADNATVAIALNTTTGSFGVPPFAGQYVNVGARPVSVTTGDVDGDGDLDFASANNMSNTVTIGFNGGASATIPFSFTGVVTVSVGQQPTTVQLADVDNDGDLDLLTSNSGGNSVSVRLNNGTGTFTGTTSIAVGAAPSDLGFADLDNDGDLDLLTTSATDGTLSVRLNNGAGAFSGTTTVALPPGSTPTGLRVGDVDADGDLDVVVAQGAGGQVITLLNTAGNLAVQYGALELKAVFGSPVSLGVTLGDVDGDGDLDVVTADLQRGLVVVGRNGGAPPVAAPTLTAVLPGAGPVGTTGIRLAGTNLSSTTAVAFNGTTASFVVNSDVQITATVPAGATTGPVSVTTVGGSATSTQSFIVTAGPVPAVQVTSTVPGRNTSAASPTAAVQTTFTSPIDNSSVPALRVFGSQRWGRQLGNVSGGGTTTLSLTPGPAFVAGERVALSVPAALTSTTGGSVKPQVIEFRVATSGTGQGVYSTLAGSVPLGGAAAFGLRSADVDNDGDLDLVGAAGSPAGLVMRLNNGTGTFSAATGLPTLTGMVGEPVPADVDGDGDLDLLVPESSANFTTMRLDVLLNNGRGQFALGSPLITTGQPNQVRVGDLDADGDLDVAYLESYNYLRVALNNGTGIFTMWGTPLNMNNPTQLRLGDLDNDGDLDAVVTVGNTLLTALNNGQAQFSLLPSVSLGASNIYSANLELGDLNRDGLLDVVTTTNSFSSTPTVPTVWIGLGTGQYAPGVAQPSLPAGANDLSLADVNTDGNLDLVAFIGSSPAPIISVRLGNGRGQLQLPTDFVVGAAGTALPSGELADFDGDGDLDVLYPAAGSTAELRLNLGRPAPTLTALSPTQGAVGSRVLLTGTSLSSTLRVNFNGVPAQSVMVLSDTQCVTVVPVGATTGLVTLATPGGMATSPGSFTVLAPLPISSQSPARNAVSVPRPATVSVSFSQAITSGNLIVNSNLVQGKRDGVAGGAGTSTYSFDPALDFAPGEQVQVSIPAAGSNVQPQVFGFTAAAGGPGQGNMRWGGFAAYKNGFATGDFDEDGDIDLVAQEATSNNLRVLFNNGQGKFSTRTQTLASQLVRTMHAADLNGDSHLDLVIAEFLTYQSGREINRLVWRAGTGLGSFGPARPLYTLYGVAAGIEVGDLNADGTPDLAALTQTADSVLVSLNIGNGVFQRRASVAAVRGATALRLADLDNDGRLDLLTAGGFSAQISRSMGTGTGEFAPFPALTYPEQVLAFDIGDVNGDGNLDLLAGTATNSSQGSVRLRLGNGLGDFGVLQAVSGAGYFDVLRLADFDGDGDLDIAAAQSIFYNGSRLLLNSGTGQFTAGLAVAATTLTRELTAADFDNDGSLDLVVAGDSASYFRSGLFTYVNHPAPPAITSFTPSSGPAGTVITLTGITLGGITSLTIGGVSLPFTIVSPTQITVATTLAVPTGPIVVSGPAGTASSSSVFTVPVPVINSFAPASGAVQRLVTLSGLYFGGTTAVRFNGTLAPGFVVTGGVQLTVSVPAGATTGLITVVTPSGTGTSASSFVVVPNPLFVSATPTRHSYSVPLGSPLTLTYTQPIDAATSASKLRLSSSLRGRRSGALSGAAPLTFTPAAPFLPGEELTLHMPPGVLDQNGNAVIGPGRGLRFRAAAGGTGRGGLVADPALTLPVVTKAVLAADFTGDEAVDFVIMSSTGGGTTTGQLYRNNGLGTFAPDPAFSMPYGNYNYLAQADLDEDGDLDLVGTVRYNGSPGWVQPFINNGTGQFQAPASLGFNTTYNPYGYAVGDLTGDGHIDLLLRDDSGLRVYPGTGAGGFSAPLAAIVGSFPIGGLQLADLDNDGDLDALAYGYQQANYYNGIVTALFNNGQGLLQLPANPPSYQYGYQNVNLGDFDGDGDLDLLMQDNGAAALALYANDGAGGFGQLLRYIGLPSAALDGMTVGDMDADGDLDALVGTAGVSLSLLRNAGNASFAQPAALVTQQSAPAAVADFDGDGDLDVYTTSNPTFSSTSLQLLRNQAVPAPLPLLSHTPATNALNVPRNTSVSLSFGQALTATNYDAWRAYSPLRQGRRRVAYVATGTATPTLTLQSPLLPGEQVSVSVPPTLQAAPAAAGVPGARVRPEVFQFTAAVGGTGTGTYTGAPGVFGYYIGGPSSLATADFNDDGVPDVLTVNPGSFGGNDMNLWFGNTNHSGTFPTHSTVGAYFNGRAHVAAADIDNDGDLDAVGIDEYSAVPNAQRSLCMALNNGNGTFNSYRYAYFPTGALAIAFADFDADGDQDLALSRPLGVEIYLNPGNGQFQGMPYVFAHNLSQPVGLAVGDLDGNGGLDLAVTDATTGAVRLWLNANDDNASLSGQTLAVAATGLTAQDIQVGDLNGDGRLDLAVLGGTGGAAGAIRLYRNTGNAAGTPAFSLSQTLALAGAPARLALADLDHDGDSDLLATAGNSVFTHFNNGNSVFVAASSPQNVGSTPTALAVADFDTDGDLDWVPLPTNTTSPVLLLFLNGGTVLAAQPSAGSPGLALHLYPNPVAGASRPVQVQVPGLGAQAASVVVFNSLGQQVHQQLVPAASAGSATLALPALAAGTYLVRLTTADRQLSRMLLVE